MADTHPTKRPVSRWLTLLLVLSLGFNLLIIGAIVGKHAAGDRMETSQKRKGPTRASAQGIRPFLSELPRDLRVSMRARAVDERTKRQEVHLTVKAGQKTLLDAIIADPFDEAVLAARLTDMFVQMEGLRGDMIQNYVDGIGTLSAEERLDYANRVQNRLDKGGKKRFKRD